MPSRRSSRRTRPRAGSRDVSGEEQEGIAERAQKRRRGTHTASATKATTAVARLPKQSPPASGRRISRRDRKATVLYTACSANASARMSVSGGSTFHEGEADIKFKLKWIQVASGQLSRWYRRDEYGYFHEPVNLEYVPDYSEVVRHPMDFGTMQKKLDTDKYESYTAFAQDFLLVCNNCMLYNQPQTPYHKFAKRLKDQGERLIASTQERLANFRQKLDEEVASHIAAQQQKQRSSGDSSNTCNQAWAKEKGGLQNENYGSGGDEDGDDEDSDDGDDDEDDEDDEDDDEDDEDEDEDDNDDNDDDNDDDHGGEKEDVESSSEGDSDEVVEGIHSETSAEGIAKRHRRRSSSTSTSGAVTGAHGTEPVAIIEDYVPLWKYVSDYYDAAPGPDQLALLQVAPRATIPPRHLHYKQTWALEDGVVEPIFRGYRESEWMELRDEVAQPRLNEFIPPTKNDADLLFSTTENGYSLRGRHAGSSTTVQPLSSSIPPATANPGLAQHGMLTLTVAKRLGLLPSTRLDVATVDDASDIHQVNRVNPKYSQDTPYTVEDYQAAIETKNEFFLVARRKVQPSSRERVVAIVNYYCMWFTGSKSQTAEATGADRAHVRSVKAAYIATLQAMKRTTHRDLLPKRAPRSMLLSEPRTGTVLLCAALEHARNAGLAFAVLDATADSVDYYRSIFGFSCVERREDNRYQPMVLRLSEFSPARALLARGPANLCALRNAGDSSVTSSFTMRIPVSLPQKTAAGIGVPSREFSDASLTVFVPELEGGSITSISDGEDLDVRCPDVFCGGVPRRTIKWPGEPGRTAEPSNPNRTAACAPTNVMGPSRDLPASMVAPDIRAYREWDEVDEVCSLIRTLHNELTEIHELNESVYTKLERDSRDFVAAYQVRKQERTAEKNTEKKFWVMHRKWLKATAPRREAERRAARQLEQKRRATQYAGSEYSSAVAAAPVQLSHQSRVEQQKMVLTMCQRLLANLEKHSAYWLFERPVDPVALGLPDYTDVVKHPMDLSTVRNKIEESRYRHFETCVQDIYLMCQNCVLYNKRDPNSKKIVVLAKQMWRRCVRQAMQLCETNGLVFSRASILDDHLDDVETVCSCHAPYNPTKFVVACDGVCGKWYHPECIGLVRCGDFLVAVDKDTGMERKRFNLSQQFLCPHCSSGGKMSTYGEMLSKSPTRSSSIPAAAPAAAAADAATDSPLKEATSRVETGKAQPASGEAFPGNISKVKKPGKAQGKQRRKRQRSLLTYLA